jgi:hypothetical protein
MLDEHRKNMKYAMLKILVILSALAAGFIFGNNRKCDCAEPFHISHKLFFENWDIKGVRIAPIAGKINPGQNSIISGKTYHESEKHFNIIENT